MARKFLVKINRYSAENQRSTRNELVFIISDSSSKLGQKGSLPKDGTRKIVISSFGLILISVVLGTAGQILFKAGTKGVKLNFDGSMIRIFFNPYILMGLFCYVSATVIYLKVLSQETLSYIYPMISLTYPLVLIFSFLIFKEPIPAFRWFGVLLIMVGVFFIGKR